VKLILILFCTLLFASPRVSKHVNIVCLSPNQESSKKVRCSKLTKKFKHIPDPEKMTMVQLRRWGFRELKNEPLNIRRTIMDCLLKNSANNPNKATVAGQ